MSGILQIIHTLESLQIDLRVKQQWEAARSLDNTIELLRHGLELEILKYENKFANSGRIA